MAKLFQRGRQLLQMSALRQAVQLTLVFLAIVCVAGLVSIVFVDREITARIDAELERRAADITTRLATTGPDRAMFYETEDRFAIFLDRDTRFGQRVANRLSRLPGSATLVLKEDEGPEDLEGPFRV